jgi:hypothetical protein
MTTDLKTILAKAEAGDFLASADLGTRAADLAREVIALTNRLAELEAPARMIETLRLSIIVALDEAAQFDYCLNLSGIEARTGIPKEIARGILFGLRADGLAEHVIGLSRDDGELAGAGYTLTPAGNTIARKEGGNHG